MVRSFEFEASLVCILSASPVKERLCLVQRLGALAAFAEDPHQAHNRAEQDMHVVPVEDISSPEVEFQAVRAATPVL